MTIILFLSFFFFFLNQRLSSSIELIVVLSKGIKIATTLPEKKKKGRRLVFRKRCKVLTLEYSNRYSFHDKSSFSPRAFFFFLKRDLKISTPIMRLYSQLTSGQILFSALSNWEFFMAKDKETGGWKNLIKERSNTTHLFEMKWRPERGRRKGGREGGKARRCTWPGPGPAEVSRANRG